MGEGSKFAARRKPWFLITVKLLRRTEPTRASYVELIASSKKHVDAAELFFVQAPTATVGRALGC